MTEGESKRLEEWRKFELFISAIEAALAPKGAVVQSPDRIADKISGQLREVDASIRFQVGSTPILITIECRDRVGIQDVTWIEQLAKKKENIGASVTVAVSSSGFTEPALRVASQVGIETRTLTDVSDTDAGKWIDGICISVEFRQWRFTRLEVVLLGAPPNVQLSSTLTEQIQTRGYEAAIAYRQADGQPLILGDLGGQFVQHGMYPPLPGIRPFGEVAPNDGTYLVATENGDFPLAKVQLEVEITHVVQPLPVRQAFEYANQHGPIVRIAEFQFHIPIGVVTLGLMQTSSK